MKKVLIIVVVIVAVIAMLTSCGRSVANSNVSEDEARQDLIKVIMGEDELVTPEINYDQDYLIICGEYMEKDIKLPLDDYNNDKSALTIGDLRQMDFSEFEQIPEITSAESWRNIAKKYKSTEDALVIFALKIIRDLALEDKNGGSSVPLVWLSEDEQTLPDISDVCIERLRYKVEILAWRYGYTTQGKVKIDLDEKRFDFSVADIKHLLISSEN